MCTQKRVCDEVTARTGAAQRGRQKVESCYEGLRRAYERTRHIQVQRHLSLAARRLSPAEQAAPQKPRTRLADVESLGRTRRGRVSAPQQQPRDGRPTGPGDRRGLQAAHAYVPVQRGHVFVAGDVVPPFPYTVPEHELRGASAAALVEVPYPRGGVSRAAEEKRMLARPRVRGAEPPPGWVELLRGWPSSFLTPLKRCVFSSLRLCRAGSFYFTLPFYFST